MTKKIKLSTTDKILQLLKECKYDNYYRISEFPNSWDFSVLQDALKFGYLTGTVYPTCYSHITYTLTSKGKFSIGLKND